MSRRTWEFSLRLKTTISWHRGVLKGARPPLLEAPAGANAAQKLCEKALFRGEIRRCEIVFFFFSRTATPIGKRGAKHGGVQVNFLVILEDHRVHIRAWWRRARGRGDLRILHIHRIFVNRRVPWRERKKKSREKKPFTPKKLKRGRLRRVRNG